MNSFSIRVFIPEVTYGAFYTGGGGVLHIMAYMRRLRAKGISFLGFRYKNG